LPLLLLHVMSDNSLYMTHDDDEEEEEERIIANARTMISFIVTVHAVY